MKKTVALIFILCLIVQVSMAQKRSVSGVVREKATNETLPGVSVLEKGTKNGTMTNIDGQFTIEVNTGAVLVFSFVGMDPVEVKVGTSSKIEVALESVNQQVEEVVVTAEFGLKRAARAIGASTQSVKGTDIAESGRENFVNSLQGRVAGVQITNSGGTPGSSSSVLIRGATSISGSNQPLYVIDGIPMSNTTFNPIGGLAAKAGSDPVVADRTLDFSNRGSDLNPEDIENITVLKGAAAAALYGSDASNGAIIITTKKGRIGRGIVNYNNYFRFDKAYRYPEMQTKYDNGMYNNTNYYTSRRFGAAYAPGTTLYNNLENLFQTGVSQKHNLSFEAGTEAMTFRAAAMSLSDFVIYRIIIILHT